MPTSTHLNVFVKRRFISQGLFCSPGQSLIGSNWDERNVFLKFEDEVLETDGRLQHNSLKRSEQSCLNDFQNKLYKM